ncbi:uncharacterized protein LOC134346627 isoform X2 [Mobula hypostoma]|uniref:uncharacterized protein LOC134346627 isoform X2 n=1 Tax=Mobula hypostoma TaxID=723540 RepID=UPI002FC3B3D4
MTLYRWATVFVFLLISDILPGTETVTGQVFQTPATVHLSEGTTLVLNCTFELNGVLTYTWSKDDCPMDFKSQRYKDKVVRPDPNRFKINKDASIRIKNVTIFDSGMYYCQIDEMGKEKKNGSGTLVIVSRSWKAENQSVAYALLVRECTSFDSAKEPIAPPRRKMNDHANCQREDAFLHCHNKEGAPKRKRPPPARRNMQ